MSKNIINILKKINSHKFIIKENKNAVLQIIIGKIQSNEKLLIENILKIIKFVSQYQNKIEKVFIKSDKGPLIKLKLNDINYKNI
jgi:ribosomal protein L1